jgi:hypothetical protein
MSYAEQAKKRQAEVAEQALSWDSTLPAEVEEKEFLVPPIGEYNFLVVSVEKTYAKSSGNPMLKVRLDLQGADGSVFDNLVISEKAMFKLVTFFESIGLKKKGEPISVGIGELADRAVNCEGRCKIKHEEYNGKINAKVDKYIVLEPKKKAPAKLTPTEEEALDLPFPIDEE